VGATVASFEQAVVMPTVTERITIMPIVRTGLGKEVSFIAVKISKKFAKDRGLNKKQN